MRLPPSTEIAALVRRSLPVAVLAGLVALGAAACGGTRSTGPTTASSTTTTAGGQRSITITDRTWHCRHRVDLDVVRVVIHDLRKDAVHLDPGCTGTIRALQVPGDGGALGPGGDGVKVHDGSHDLQVLGGYVNCGEKAPGKHQDAIQAMGGARVVFHHITSRGCGNSFMFINWGNDHRGLPTGIVCDGCRAVTNNYSVFVGNSKASGARGSTFSSRVGPRALPDAIEPVLAGNGWTQRAPSRS